MSVRNNGLLLSNAATPAAGINKTQIKQWYGGQMRLGATGVFDGATIDVVASTRLPKSGDPVEFGDATKFTDDDFSVIATTTEPGSINIGHVNACAIGVRVTSPGANTRVKIIVA